MLRHRLHNHREASCLRLAHGPVGVEVEHLHQQRAVQRLAGGRSADDRKDRGGEPRKPPNQHLDLPREGRGLSRVEHPVRGICVGSRERQGQQLLHTVREVWGHHAQNWAEDSCRLGQRHRAVARAVVHEGHQVLGPERLCAQRDSLQTRGLRLQFLQLAVDLAEQGRQPRRRDAPDDVHGPVRLRHHQDLLPLERGRGPALGRPEEERARNEVG
mmetsp:Transcript_82864/g.234787  ORF Transcript_82864/g.234787 Transcript_82864/m.234787 type:complete len:215 (+) Transcript_82864:351-995(+)